MVMVISIDGKITNGDDSEIYKWTSKEDHEFFSSIKNKNNLLVMGSKTYEAARQNMVLCNKKLRIILTKNLNRYVSNMVPEKLEFSNESPRMLVDRLSKKGYKKLLLLGGGHINTAFLNAGLVSEIFLTIEPKIFGSGKSFVVDELKEKSLKLINFKKLNDHGTLLLHYKII